MAMILIYEPDDMLARKLCDSLKKEKFNAKRCDENNLSIEELNADKPPLVLLDARLKWTACRPLLRNSCITDARFCSLPPTGR